MLALASCTKPDAERVSVSFIARADVKAPLQSDDALERLDLLVFRSLDGAIDTYASGGGHSIRASVTAGYRMNWHLVANAPAGAFDSVVNEEGFLARNTLLEHTTESTLVMHGSGTKVFNSGESPTTVVMQRYASKVSVERVAVSWLGEFAYTPPCILETVALVNARGQISWEGTPSASSDGLWYNRSGIDALSGIVASCLVAHPNISIASADAVDVGTELYAMPNPSASEPTRLVLGMRIDGILQWYPIDLPPMQSNTHYSAKNVYITGPGALEPGGDLDRRSISFTVELQPWGSETSNVDFGT